MKIVFFGTSSSSALILEALSQDSRFQIAAIVTTPDKPVGRKQELQESAVAQLGTALTVPVHKLPTLRTPEVESLLRTYDADIFLVAVYGKIIPQNILDIPKIAPINVHISLLPKYRGASPVHGALLHGEERTGVTVMRMDAEVDHGDIYISHNLDIEPDECEPQLDSRLAALAAEYIATDLEQIASGALQPVPQDHSQATFTKFMEKEDGHIDWTRSAENIYNQFRAYYEWPGVFSFFEGKRVKILDCRSVTEDIPDAKPGSVLYIEGSTFVACEKDFLLLLLIQPEGKQPMLPMQFINGHASFVGTVLE